MTTETVDIAVVGTGAMGSMALWRLASRGASVAGFDRLDPPHDRGSSGGESRVIRTAYYEGPEYVPLAQRSFALWRQLEDETGTDLLTENGGLMIGHPESELVAGALRSARVHGLTHRILTAAEMGHAYPQHRLRPDEIAVFEHAAGFLRPEAAIGAALQRAEALGAAVYPECPVEDVRPQGDGVRLRVDGRTIEARHAIVAAGPWLPRLLPDLPVPLQVTRQVLTWFPVRDPAAFAPERFPIFMHTVSGERICYGFPSLDGETVKLAVHHEGEVTTADEVDRSIRPSDIEPVQAFIADWLEGIEPTVARAKVCMYTNTPDFHFLVGPLPGAPQITILGGFSGHGFKFASVLGDIAADLALDGGTKHAIELFSLDRFGAR